MTLSKDRNMMIDVIKGIGIISIVVGHVCWEVKIGDFLLPIGPFVYLYHLVIFFFCSGYCYKTNSVDNYLIKKIKSLYLPFLCYSFLFLLLRNLFLKLNILNGIPYTFEDLIIVGTNILTFNGNGELLSAFWFLPVLFVGLIIFSIIDQLLKKHNIWVVFGIALIIFCGYIGLYATDEHLGLLLNMQIAYLMIPIIAIGSMYKKIETVINKWINIVTLIICFLVMLWVLYANIGIIELSKFMIINKVIFYPISIIGILFCLCVAKIICKYQFFAMLVAYIGKYSFDIMAVHFVSFKIIDLLYFTITKQECVMSDFPYSYNQLSIKLFYIIAGIFLPIFLKKLYLKFKSYLSNNIIMTQQ